MLHSSTRWYWVLGLLLVAGAFGSGFWLGRVAEPEAITVADVAHAERILGLTFTDAERDSMLAELTEQRDNYAAVRKLNLPNDVVPAVQFDPIPADWKAKPVFDSLWDRNKIVDRMYGVRVTPWKDSAWLAFASVTELSQAIKYREITSERLTRYFLNRLKTHDKTLHCVITLTEDTAIAQARRADAEIRAGKYRGPLHGIPYGAKDLLAARGYPTTWGSAPYRNQKFNYDAEVIQQLRNAGAVLVAKLTLGELAYGDVWYGEKTRNPWNPAEGSSGSSAGSASAVSAGLVPFAIGTETLGSIVSPSTICGTTGLRPTYGRVSTKDAMALTWSMDKIGPITRTVEDAVLVSNAIIMDAPGVAPAPFKLWLDAGMDMKKVRIGYVKSAFEGRYAFRSQDSASLAKLRELGAELVPIELPKLPIRELTTIITAEGAAAFAELTEQNRDDLMKRQTKDAWPNLFRAARFIPAVDYIQANRARTLLINQMDSLLHAHNIHVYVAPSWSANLTLTNLTGHPSIVVPNGFRTDAKGISTPTSISFTGRLYDEGMVAAVAHQYQQATDWHRQHPPGF